MKFPRVARLDDTDERVYERAAEVGEPAVTGSFQYTLSAHDPTRFEGKEKQAFRHAFLGTHSFGHCTVVTAGDITEVEYKAVIEALAQHLLDVWGAPSLAEALPVARREVEYAADLCAEHDPEASVVLALERSVTAEGGIQETFKTVQPRARWDGERVRVWQIEQESPSDSES